MRNQSKNLIKILIIFSTNLYTLEDKTMNQRATEYKLNDAQFEQLKTAYVNTILDSMSTKDLYEYVYQDYENELENYTLNRLIEEIKYTLDEEFLDEMITTIKQKIKD